MYGGIFIQKQISRVDNQKAITHIAAMRQFIIIGSINHSTHTDDGSFELLLSDSQPSNYFRAFWFFFNCVLLFADCSWCAKIEPPRKLQYLQYAVIYWCIIFIILRFLHHSITWVDDSEFQGKWNQILNYDCHNMIAA